MFKQIFKNIDNYIWKDNGCDNPIDYAEQASWILFLKWLDDYEEDEIKKAKLNNKTITPFFDKEYKWSSWAIVKKNDGTRDYNAGPEGEDLIEFVDKKLFPYLASFKENSDVNTLKYKIGLIFSEIKNKIESGYILKDVFKEVDKLRFRSDDEKHELSDLYETKIQDMGNAGRTGGQYYTPRPLIKTIVDLVNPKIGEVIYDGAAGSCGFLVEAYNHIKKNKSLTTSELKKLETESLYGKEQKKLAHLIGIMNMILHGIESPNVDKTNTLEENILDFQEKDKVDVILANPPFGGGETEQIQDNFPIKSGESAYLFMQHFIKKLKKGGRAGIIIKNTFLSNNDAKLIRKELLETCNLHSILSLPTKVFTAGVTTVVLFLEKGKSTKNIWYYQLNLDRNLGKTNALNEKDLEEFSNFFNTKQESENSWNLDINNINKDTWDLNVKNPNKVEEEDNRTTKEILSEIEELDSKASQALQSIKELL